eukprot:2267736-Rhodomonas_salina.3
MAAPAASSYQYDTTQPASDYTYTAMPSSDGLTFYNAQETSPQMTVINGYATEGNNMEQWNTIPVGTLHPLDTAGDWESGAFNSINPDGTARASAPLTLSGERADGTVKSEDARASRGMGLVPSQLKGARLTELLQLPARSERAIWNTPSSKVEKLSPHDQQVWAKHVMAQHALHKVTIRTSAQQGARGTDIARDAIRCGRPRARTCANCLPQSRGPASSRLLSTAFSQTDFKLTHVTAAPCTRIVGAMAGFGQSMLWRRRRSTRRRRRATPSGPP